MKRFCTNKNASHTIPKDLITERQMMIGVYNHILRKVFRIQLPFSEGDWIHGSHPWEDCIFTDPSMVDFLKVFM